MNKKKRSCKYFKCKKELKEDNKRIYCDDTCALAHNAFLGNLRKKQKTQADKHAYIKAYKPLILPKTKADKTKPIALVILPFLTTSERATWTSRFSNLGIKKKTLKTYITRIDGMKRFYQSTAHTLEDFEKAIDIYNKKMATDSNTHYSVARKNLVKAWHLFNKYLIENNFIKDK